MTTVINYNFFGIDADSVFGDFGLKNHVAEKKQSRSPKQQRTIDITAQSRVLDEDETYVKQNIKRHRTAARFAVPSSIITAYDRQGKPVHHFDSTGLHVDCRV